MKIQSKALRAILFAITGAVASTASSQAAVSLAAPAANDIFIGFRASSDTGNTKSYIVNVGQYSTFRDLPAGTTITLNLGSVGADLIATYGANWNSRNTVSWGAFGLSIGTSTTVYGSRERPSASEQSPAWEDITAPNRSSTGNQISPVLTGLGGFLGKTSTDNSNFAFLQNNSADAWSYNQQVGIGANDFGTVSGWTSIEANFGDGTGGALLDLYRFGSIGVTTPGYFSISDLGVISFTAVPEPSIALLALGGISLGVLRRRRTPATL